MRLRQPVIGSSALRRFCGGAALFVGAASAVLGSREPAAVGGNCRGHSDHLSNDLACGYGWAPIGTPHGFNGNSTPWEISNQVDDDYFGAIVAGMERWNHQSTSGFFRYHGSPANGDGDNDHLGTFICAEGVNLVRQSGDSSTGWCNMSIFHSQGSDAFTFSACNNRWHIHVCDPAPDVAEAVSAFTHEFGHVNRLCHLEDVRDGHAPNNGDVVSIMRSHRSEPGGMSEDRWPSDVYCSDCIWGNRVGDASTFRKDHLHLFTRTVGDDGRSVWEYHGRLQATDFGHLPADIFPDISDTAISGGSAVFSDHGDFSLAYIGQGNADGAGWSIRPLGDLQDVEID